MTREEKINTLKAIIQECEEYQWQRKETLFEIIKDLEQEPTEEKHLKTCGTCRYFRKNQSKENIEICKELYGENTMCGHCTYWEDTHEVALPTTEYNYCSHHREEE